MNNSNDNLNISKEDIKNAKMNPFKRNGFLTLALTGVVAISGNFIAGGSMSDAFYILSGILGFSSLAQFKMYFSYLTYKKNHPEEEYTVETFLKEQKEQARNK